MELSKLTLKMADKKIIISLANNNNSIYANVSTDNAFLIPHADVSCEIKNVIASVVAKTVKIFKSFKISHHPGVISGNAYHKIKTNLKYMIIFPQLKSYSLDRHFLNL